MCQSWNLGLLLSFCRITNLKYFSWLPIQQKIKLPLPNWTFCYFVMCKCRSTNVCILFDLFSSCSWDWTLWLSWVMIVYCSTCILTFSPLKPKNRLKKEKRNVSEIKYEFVITLKSGGLTIVIWFKIGNKT